jgi:hypothetical protein
LSESGFTGFQDLQDLSVRAVSPSAINHRLSIIGHLPQGQLPTLSVNSIPLNKKFR